jgi:hypothetical protein
MDSTKPLYMPLKISDFRLRDATVRPLTRMGA